MEALRCLPILSLVLICVSSAPTMKDVSKAKDESLNVQDLTILLEDKMFDNIGAAKDENEHGDEMPFIHETTDKDEGENEQDQKEDGIEDEYKDEDDGDYAYSTEFESLPSWYIDQLVTAKGTNDSQQSDQYQNYKTELDQLILDVKLYQVYHSIKTLKSVLDDLIDDERKEAEDGDDEEQEEKEEDEQLSRDISEEEEEDEEEEGVKGSGGGQSLKILTDRQIVIAKQLGDLKNQNQNRQKLGPERSSRRIKRDLNFGDDDVIGGREIGGSEWNDGKPNLRWMVKFDEDDEDYDGSYTDIPLQGEDGFDETANEFDLTKTQIEDVLSTFFPVDGESSIPSGNEVNINVGDQSLSQQIWYPAASKRSLHRTSMDRNYLSRLPTLEGMRKRRRTYIPIRRSRNDKKTILDRYIDDVTTTPYDRETLVRNQIAKLAQRLAHNTQRPNGRVPMINEYTNGPAGDVNMWFENNPMYNIGVDDNIGDTFGLMDLDLPRTSPDRVAQLQQTGGNRRDWSDLRPRLQRRSHIVEEPSLPGPYQGYFMEGQLWHDMLTKRSAPVVPLGMKPKNLKIGGPNAWGNFIFINDNGLPPNDGEWFSQSFGDNIGNSAEGGPMTVETEGMWDDGDDDDEDTDDEEPDMKEQEKEWIRRILGFDD